MNNELKLNLSAEVDRKREIEKDARSYIKSLVDEFGIDRKVEIKLTD